MLTKDETAKVIQTLDRLFPNPKPSLKFSSAFELMIATMLSAQCTDERVNRVTKNLFLKYNTPEKIIALGQPKLRKIIHSCGYHNQKSKNIIASSKTLLKNYNGKVPNTMEELTALPGIGRKTAGVILAQWFKVPAFPVDTHVFRVSNRLGLVREKTPEKTNTALRKRIPKEHWIPLHFQLIFHGRKTCKAPKPLCWECPLKSTCKYPKKTSKP